MAVQEPCIVCSEPTEHKCSNCQDVHYCSRDHQKQHWKQHKRQCIPARIKQDGKYGRYLEASRNIKSGDIIMKEAPLITGPSQVTPPVCLGCYKLLEEGSTVSCQKCGWPFCSESCSQKEVHKPECYYTQQRGEKVSISTFGIPHPNYQCITVLRCLYQRDHNAKLWTKLQALESHDEDRRDTDKWVNDRKMIAEFIWNFFKLDGTFNEGEIMKCCGIIQINAHEVPLLEPEYVAVFDKISMVEHNCFANCNKSFTSDGSIILTAGVNISPGSHISVCYTDPLWGTEARRHHLSDSKFFECSCERCSDVTEFGTMFSAVKCKKKDCKGYLLPETFIVPILHKTKSPNPSTRGLDDKFWKCNTCKDEVSDAIIQQLLQDIGRELSAMPKGDPDACERFVNHCSSYLHPSHYYMTDVSLALTQMIGQQDELGLAAISDDRLLLKTQLCRKITDLLEILAPVETLGSWSSSAIKFLKNITPQFMAATADKKAGSLFAQRIAIDIQRGNAASILATIPRGHDLYSTETRLRGSLLFEMHAAVAESGRRKSLTDGPMVMLGYITESRKILLESAGLLAHEPPELPEGRLGRQAKINLIQMDELIKNLSAALPSPL